jgi:KRAB domain-containing zinc finger protein
VQEYLISRRPHKCDECGKTFASKANLRAHKLHVHINERKYGCADCPKLFVTWQHLRLHQCVHTGERPFK